MKLHIWFETTGKTAAWLADRTGLSASYLSRLAGRSSGGIAERSPSIETCARIAEATGGAVTATDFMPDVCAVQREHVTTPQAAHRRKVA